MKKIGSISLCLLLCTTASYAMESPMSLADCNVAVDTLKQKISSNKHVSFFDMQQAVELKTFIHTYKSYPAPQSCIVKKVKGLEAVIISVFHQQLTGMIKMLQEPITHQQRTSLEEHYINAQDIYELIYDHHDRKFTPAMTALTSQLQTCAELLYPQNNVGS